jgi:arylsulfatase A-like enzyme
VAILGDHGEELMQDGFFGHLANARDAELHVPLILWGPGGLPRGRRVAQITQLIDLTPTVLDYALGAAGSGSSSTLDGRSLRPLIEDAGSGAERAAEAYAEGACDMVTVRTPQARLVCRRSSRQPVPALNATDFRYLRIVDGKERDAGVEGTEAQGLRNRLEEWVRRVTAKHP